MPPKDNEHKNLNQPLTYKQLQNVNFKYFPNLDITKWEDYGKYKSQGYSEGDLDRIMRNQMFKKAFGEREDYDKLKKMNPIQRDSYYIQSYLQQNHPDQYVNYMKELYPNRAEDIDKAVNEFKKESRKNYYENANSAQKRELVQLAVRDILYAEDPNYNNTLTSEDIHGGGRKSTLTSARWANNYLKRLKEYPQDVIDEALNLTGYSQEDIKDAKTFASWANERKKDSYIYGTGADYLSRNVPSETIVTTAGQDYKSTAHGFKDYELNKTKELVRNNQPLTVEEANIYNDYIKKLAEEIGDNDLINYNQAVRILKEASERSWFEQKVIHPLFADENIDVDELAKQRVKEYNDFVNSHAVIPYKQNSFAYGSLTLDNFKDVVKQVCPEYEKYGGSKWAPDSEIDYEQLYNLLGDKLKAGQIGEVSEYLTNHINNILAKNQAGWWESGDDLLPSKRDVFLRTTAAATAKALLNAVMEPTGFALGLTALPLGENFWEYQRILPNVSQNIYEAIKGGDNMRVYSEGTFSDVVAEAGDTFGAAIGLVIETMLTRGAGSAIKNVSAASKYNKITGAALAIEAGLDEGSGDAIQIFKDVLQKGENEKNDLIDRKYNEYLQEYNPNRPYNADRAQQIFQDMFRQQGQEMFNNLRNIQQPEDKQWVDLRTDADINHEVNERLKLMAIAKAQAEQWFDKNNQNYDEYVRHQANTAYGRTLIEEAAIASIGSLFGLGIEGRIIKSRLVKPAEWIGIRQINEGAENLANWLAKSGKLGKAAAYTGRLVAKGTGTTVAEIPEEILQEYSNTLQKKRAERNIENYAKGLYYGVGADFITSQELGFLQGVMDLAPEIMNEVDEEEIIKSVAYTTLLVGGLHNPLHGKSREQIKLDNSTKIGEVFDYIRHYFPYHSMLGDISAELKADMYEKPNIVQKGFENYYNDAKVTETRQSIAAAVNIGSQMIKAAEEGNVEEYQKQQAAYQVSLGIMLDNLNKNNPKYAKSFIELLQNRANANNLNKEEQNEILQQWLDELSTNDMRDLSREEQLDFMVSSSQEVLSLMKESERIRRKYEADSRFKNKEIRHLIFGELLNDLSHDVIGESWKELSTSVEKVLADNATNEKFKSDAYQYVINNYFKENNFNERLNALVDIIQGNVKDIRKEDLLNAFDNISHLLEMEIPNAKHIMKSDVNLIKWRSDIYKEWNENFDKVLKGEGLVSEEEIDTIHKDLTTNKYKKKVSKEIRKRRKSINDLTRYLDSLQNAVDAKKHENDRYEIFKELEEKNPDSYKNLTKALEILNTAENVKDVLKEASLKNKDIQKIYNTLEQAVDLVKLNVENASDLLNIGTYANVINDPSGITQGYLTDVLSDIQKQSEIPEVSDNIETVEEPIESNPNKHTPKVDSIKTKDRIKQHRKSKTEARRYQQEIEKAEAAALVEKEKVEEEFQHFEFHIGELLEQFDNDTIYTSDQLQDALKDIQQLISYVNSRDFRSYIDRHSLDSDLDVLEALENNIIIKLAKAIHEEQINSKEAEKIESEIKKHTEQIKKESKVKQRKSFTTQVNKIKKIKPSDFIKMQERIASIFNDLRKQNASYERIISYIWKDKDIKDILKTVFGTEKNMSIFYETVKDFNNYAVNTIEDAKHIVNQVVLANILNVDPQLLQVEDILDKRTYQKLKEIFGHGNVKKQHKEALEKVLDDSTPYYNATIAAYNQLYRKISEAYNNNQQIVLQEAPDDCKLTVKIDGKKVPLIISKRQAEKENNKTKETDSSLIFEDSQSNREIPIETGSRIDWARQFNESINFLSGAKTLSQVKRAIEEEAFQHVYSIAQSEVEESIGYTITLDENIPEISNEDETFYEDKILEDLYNSYLEAERDREYPIVLELNGNFLPYYTKNNNYKSGEVITIQTEDGIKAATVLYYGLPENGDYNIKATSLDKVVAQPKTIPTRKSNKGINAKIIRPAIREDNTTISQENYKEVQDRIDYAWANDGNVHIGDNIGFVVYTWNSPDGPRRVIYYTTEKQEDGSYHILEVLDQGSYSKQINPNSPIGQLINRIREADNGTEGFYYQEQGWQVDKVTYNHANPTNNKLSFEESNLNKILDEENGVFGIKTDGKVNRVILIKQDRTGFVSTDKNFTQDTLLNSNPNSERDKSTRVASSKEGDSMRENIPFIVTPTTDGYEALLLANFIGPSTEGYMDIIKRSLLNGKIGEIFKEDILQRITDLFRNTRIKGAVEKPASVSLAKFFKTNNQALIISNDNGSTCSIYLTAPDGFGGITSTLLATVNYPADINNASKEDKTAKELISSSQLEIVNGVTGVVSMTNFDNIYKAIINKLVSETNPVINSININFEQIQNNPIILDALIADGMLWSSYAPLNSNGKIKRTGAQVFGSNRMEKPSVSKENKQIALVNFEVNGPIYGYNIDGLDVQPGDNVESKFGGSQGRVVATMTIAEYEQYRSDNKITDKWTAENVLSQPKATFIDRHSQFTTPAPIITAYTTEYTPTISNEENVKGNIPKPVQTIRKKKTGTTKSVQLTQQQSEKITQQDNVGTLPSSEVIQENIFKSYEQITDDKLLERLDEVDATEELWNKLDPFARERLLTCGKW